MGKLKSLEELKKIKESAKSGTELRTTSENDERTVISIGMATCGIAAGARETMKALLDEISKNSLENISVVATGCLGYCYAEPLVEVHMPGAEVIRYANVDDGMACDIIRKHVMHGIFLDNAIMGKEVPPRG